MSITSDLSWGRSKCSPMVFSHALKLGTLGSFLCMRQNSWNPKGIKPSVYSLNLVLSRVRMLSSISLSAAGTLHLHVSCPHRWRQIWPFLSLWCCKSHQCWINWSACRTIDSAKSTSELNVGRRTQNSRTANSDIYLAALWELTRFREGP